MASTITDNGTEASLCPSLLALKNIRDSHLHTWCAMTFIVEFLITVANCTLIYGLYKTNQLGIITNKFIIFMSISDLCTGILVQPLIVILILSKSIQKNCSFLLKVQFLAFLFAYFSFFMLVAVAVDRYLHVIKLNRYNSFMNEYRMKIITGVSFLASIIAGLIPVLVSSFCLQVILNMADAIGIAFIIILYILLRRKVRVHAVTLQNDTKEVSEMNSGRKRSGDQFLSRTVLLLFVVMFFLLGPYNIMSVIFTYYKFHQQVDPGFTVDVLSYWAYILVFTNSSVNAIIFAYSNSRVRRYFSSVLGLVQNDGKFTGFDLHGNEQITRC